MRCNLLTVVWRSTVSLGIFTPGWVELVRWGGAGG